MTLATGSNATVDQPFSFQQHNRIKSHFRAASEPADIQAGMIFSDSDDNSLWHHGASSKRILHVGDGNYIYIPVDPIVDILSSMTMDNTWRDYDATGDTSANAKWIHIRAMVDVAVFQHNAEILFCQKDNDAEEYGVKCYGDDDIGGTVYDQGSMDMLIPLDASQAFSYKGNKSVSGAYQYVDVLGYIE